jgi:hypothetical protein
MIIRLFWEEVNLFLIEKHFLLGVTICSLFAAQAAKPGAEFRTEELDKP